MTREYNKLTVDEIISQGDILLGRLGESPLRDWVEAEQARRTAEAEAWRVGDITTPFGPLVIGAFYDVTQRGYSAGDKPQSWRNCRYVGRTKDYRERDAYQFERFGASGDGSGRRNTASAERLSGITPVTLSTKVAAAVAKFDKAAADMVARREAHRAAVKEARAVE